MEQLNKQAYTFGGIFSLANRLQNLGDKIYKDISIKQWFLIAVISKNPHPAPTLSEVAKIIGNSRQNVKKLALILQKRGFVTLTKDPEDARMIRISLTPKCIDYFNEHATQELAFMKALFNEFDETLTEGLYQGIKKLDENTKIMEDYHENQNGR